jgi:hypothetical protein
MCLHMGNIVCLTGSQQVKIVFSLIHMFQTAAEDGWASLPSLSPCGWVFAVEADPGSWAKPQAWPMAW